MLLIEPEVAEERHTEIIERTKATVTEGGGTWHGVEPWGKRKLAYEINHHADAFYYVLTFDAPVPALEEATRVLRITDGVLRYMAVAKPPAKTAAAPAEKAKEPEQAEAPREGQGRLGLVEDVEALAVEAVAQDGDEGLAVAQLVPLDPSLARTETCLVGVPPVHGLGAQEEAVDLTPDAAHQLHRVLQRRLGRMGGEAE